MLLDADVSINESSRQAFSTVVGDTPEQASSIDESISRSQLFAYVVSSVVCFDELVDVNNIVL